MPLQFPNIILIIMDTASAKHMSLYGYHRHTTPELERLASKATLYTRCFAPSCWTLPSHASMFTGLYPSEHGVDGYNVILDPNYQHIVSILKQRGYRSYAISCNGLVSPLFGNCRDFDIFFDYTGINWLNFKIVAKEAQYFHELYKKLSKTDSRWRRIQIILEYTVRHQNMGFFLSSLQNFLSNYIRFGALKYSAPSSGRSFRTALQQINKHQQSEPEIPFFLFINVMENHAFYNPPKEWRAFSRPSDRQTAIPHKMFSATYKALGPHLLPIWCNLYDDTFLFLDNLIYQLWEQLQALGISDNTLFIVTSDHGEHLGEKGFFGHTCSLYNELIWVPLLIHYPNGMQSSGTDDRLVSLSDLFATILDITQSPFPCPRYSYSLLSSERRSSVSAMNLNTRVQKVKLAKEAGNSSDWAGSFVTCDYALILDNNVKLIQQDNGNISIYHLGRDPAEEHDLSVSLEPQIKEELLRLLAHDQKKTGFSI